MQQIDKFIYENHLIEIKKAVEETIESIEAETDLSSENGHATQSSNLSNLSDQSGNNRIVKEVKFRVPADYFELSEIDEYSTSDQHSSASSDD
jgi:hypothetical protein